MAKKSLDAKYNKADKHLKKISGTIGAIVVIIGAVTGCVSWLHIRLDSAIGQQVESLRSEIETSDMQQKQAITRLELSNLIRHDPYNTAAIEKMARYYFYDLKGDLYMTQMFSKWRHEYDGDATIIMGEEE